jgi:phenylacetate-coenzyme A ligase PaaK-like adenylate-forming protein
MQDLIEMIERFKVTVIGGIGSFCRRLIVEAERKGRNFSLVRNVLAMGEGVPKGMREDMRNRLQNMGAKNVFISNPFGFTECQASFAECYEFSGCHNYDPSLYFMEVVNPDTGERLPDGETGLLAISHLNRRGTVLLRYLIGDISAITNETCKYCGRHGQRLIIKTGSTYGTRTKELVKLKGTLINPETMKSEISNVPGVAEYQIIFTKEDLKDSYSSDKLLVKVAVSDRNPEDVAKEIRERILLTAEMTPKVEVVKAEEIYDPTKTLKATRVVDLRPTE